MKNTGLGSVPAEYRDAIKRALTAKADSMYAYTPENADKLAAYWQAVHAGRWDGLMGCYGFDFASMFHGVEKDGYIHT